MRVVQYTRTVTVREFSFRFVRKSFTVSKLHVISDTGLLVNFRFVRKNFTVSKLHVISDTALLVKFDRGAMSLRSVQFVRSVKFLTVCNDEFTVRKLHVISDTYNIFGFTGKVVEGSNVYLRDRKSTRLNSSHRPLYRMPSSA